MQAVDLLCKLKGQGFTLKAEGDLLYVSPKERLTDDLRQLIRAQKAELLRLLKDEGISALPYQAERLIAYAEALAQRLKPRESD